MKTFKASFDASARHGNQEATISYRIVSPKGKAIMSYAKKANFRVRTTMQERVKSLELEALISLLREIEKRKLRGVSITGDCKYLINQILQDPLGKRQQLAKAIIDEYKLKLKFVPRVMNQEADLLTKRVYEEGNINTAKKKLSAPEGQYCTLLNKCSICKQKKFYQAFPTRAKNPYKRDSRCYECRESLTQAS